MKYVKFVDGKGSVVTDFTTDLIPRIGEHVQFYSQGVPSQAKVTRVMTVYGKAGDWVLVTVETES